MLRRWFLATLAAPAWRGYGQAAMRPRVMLNAVGLRQLRAAISGSHAGLWKLVSDTAHAYALQKPPKYKDPDPDDEQLWEREVGNKLPFLAMVYLLTGDTLFAEAAARWSLASCAYPTWGLGKRDGVDLAAGHQLFGLAIVYDWLHDALGEADRETIRQTLLKRGGVLFEAARSTAYWRTSFLQNHLWVNAVGLMAAAQSLDGEAGTAEWIALARDKFLRTEASLGPDGASHEGASYWTYGAEYLLKFWSLNGGHVTSEWWKHTAEYYLYLTLPRNSWTAANTIIDLGDSPRFGWYGPDYQLRRLASMNRDGHAQWLAQALESARVAHPIAQWLNLLWYDPSVKPKPPDDLGTLRHFEDMGIVSARSGWTGDESLVVFKCGPPLGHAATDAFAYDAGSGHVHPDANHFVLFGAGEWLLRDDGYAWKQTDQHNTLTVNGKGQMGEGGQWFRGSECLKAKAHPRIVSARSSAEVDEIAGDATAIYPKASGLTRFVRRLYFLKPDVLIVADEIESEREQSLELRFHPEFEFVSQTDGALLATGKKAVLRMELLTPDGVELTAGPMAARDRDGKPMSLMAAQLRTSKAKWRNAVAFSWCIAGQAPIRVRLEREGERWIFHAGTRQVTWG